MDGSVACCVAVLVQIFLIGGSNSSNIRTVRNLDLNGNRMKSTIGMQPGVQLHLSLTLHAMGRLL